MSQVKQILTVTAWEYKRFFKLKNELIGILVMLLVSAGVYLITRYAMSQTPDDGKLTVTSPADPALLEALSGWFEVETVSPGMVERTKERIASEREGILLSTHGNSFEIFAYRESKAIEGVIQALNSYQQVQNVDKLGVDAETLTQLLSPAAVESHYVRDAAARQRTVLAYFFAGMMIWAVFLCFAYQFTAITGEKQLRITEQIVSAIKPQAWMDGKILGITLTGISSILVYSAMAPIGMMLFFQFTGRAPASILGYLHIPSIALFIAFTIMGVLMWNSILAAIASVITDPNNSAKSSLMMLPVAFIAASFLIINHPDGALSTILSWVPLTSATAMPIRWATTEVAIWEVIGSFAVLMLLFYLLRKLAAKIFRVSILISGKEPTWGEVLRLARME